MIIVLLLFFKSICLYCQRLVLYIHDRWINPKNVRLLKEAAEAQGAKFQIEEYRRVKKSKKRRYVTNFSSADQTSNALGGTESCRFCSNTPQGYCRHHFHLQELHVQKQQRQQKFWCPLSGVVAGTNRIAEFRQLRQIKRELKRNIQKQQELKLAKTSSVAYEALSPTNNYPPVSPLSNTTPTTIHQSSGDISSFFNKDDSGYQTFTGNASCCLDNDESVGLQHHQEELNSDIDSIVSTYSSDDYVDIELPSPCASLVETTYSFETCCETPNHSSSEIPRNSSFSSFVSCEYSTMTTTYL